MLCIPQEFFEALSGRSNLQAPPPRAHPYNPERHVQKPGRKLTEKEKAFMASHAAESKRGAAKAASSAHGGQHHVEVAITLEDHDLATFHGDNQKALLKAMHGHVDPKGKVRRENGARSQGLQP